MSVAGRRRTRLFESSTFRGIAVAALLAWIPGAVLISLQHQELTESLLAEDAAELAERTEELLWEFRLHGSRPSHDDLGEALEVEEIEDESLDEFRERYVSRIRAELRESESGARFLEERLVLLGESDARISHAVAEAVFDVMRDEIPEIFYEDLEERRDDYFDDEDSGSEDSEGEDSEAEDLEILDRELVTRDLLAAIDEIEELRDHSGCLGVESSDGSWLRVNFAEILSSTEIGPRLLIHARGEGRIGGSRARDLEDDVERWCLAEYLPLADGGRLLAGIRVDDHREMIQRSANRRNLLLALGLPLALALAWWQSAPIVRFLDALGTVARRLARGDFRSRLRIEPANRDLRHAISTVHRMLDQLERTVQDLARISDNIAHDLRTPLARLQGQLDLLKQSPDPTGELIEAVQSEADRLLETFNSLLRIAQVETGNKKQGFKDLDFAEILRDVTELYAPVFSEKGIDLVLAIPAHRVPYHGDRNLWMQALSNLIDNALKYTPKGGKVHLELNDRGSRPRIRLADTGPGIPRSERENVFRRFYRLQRHRGEPGSGLGLSLVGAVCDMHEAQIRLGGKQGLVIEIDL